MCNNEFYPKGLTPLKTGPGIVERLAGLRRAFEKGGNTRIYEFSAPAILLLADVCEALGLGKEEQARVLGREGAKQVHWKQARQRPLSYTRLTASRETLPIRLSCARVFSG